MINPKRNEDRRDRGGPRQLGRQAAPLAVREPKALRTMVHTPSTLEDCEADIQSSFERVAAAFKIIKEKRLYLETGCTSFEQYCEERWQISPRRGYQFAEAGKTIKSLPAGVRTMVHSERVAREVAAIPKEHRVEVLKTVAKAGPVTAKAVRETAAPFTQPDVGQTLTGDQLADAGCLPEEFRTPAEQPEPLTTTITSVTDASEIRLAHCPTCTCKGES